MCGMRVCVCSVCVVCGMCVGLYVSTKVRDLLS